MFFVIIVLFKLWSRSSQVLQQVSKVDPPGDPKIDLKSTWAQKGVPGGPRGSPHWAPNVQNDPKMTQNVTPKSIKIHQKII